MRRHKYRAKPVQSEDGHFASKKEYKRWNELKLLQQTGEIENLQHDPKACKFVLHGRDGSKVCDYIPDYIYTEGGKSIAEDCKGMKTRIYRLKRKLFQAEYKHWIHRES